MTCTALGDVDLDRRAVNIPNLTSNRKAEPWRRIDCTNSACGNCSTVICYNDKMFKLVRKNMDSKKNIKKQTTKLSIHTHYAKFSEAAQEPEPRKDFLR